MKNKLLLSTLLMGACVLPSSAAVEYWVATNGDDANPGTEARPFASVEAAVLSTKANTETVIHLQKDATFLIAKIDFQENKTVKIIGDNTTLLGADKPGHDGGEGNRIMRAAGGCNIEIEGVTFKNGRQVGYFPGGAIFFSGKKLAINNCRFIGNEAGSAGGAIGARSAEVIVKNSYFEDNYIIGGGGVGSAIMQCGNGASSLIVENCTFYKNHIDQGGSHATVIGIYDPSENAGYSSVDLLDVRNCTFVQNTNATGYQSSVDISDSGWCELRLVNNTFYNEESCIGFDIQDADIYMFNNFMHANKIAIINNRASIAAYDRMAITGYNNVVIGGEMAINDNIDDPCFNGSASANANIVGTANSYPVSDFGIVTNISMDRPYLTLMAASSLVNAGMDDTSAYTNGENLVLGYDCRNGIVTDRRDIGAYENGASFEDGIISVSADDNAAPVYYNLQGVRVENPSNGIYIERRGNHATKVLFR